MEELNLNGVLLLAQVPPFFLIACLHELVVLEKEWLL